jgi:hypothetical protein
MSNAQSRVRRSSLLFTVIREECKEVVVACFRTSAGGIQENSNTYRNLSRIPGKFCSVVCCSLTEIYGRVVGNPASYSEDL